MEEERRPVIGLLSPLIGSAWTSTMGLRSQGVGHPAPEEVPQGKGRCQLESGMTSAGIRKKMKSDQLLKGGRGDPLVKGCEIMSLTPR